MSSVAIEDMVYYLRYRNDTYIASRLCDAVGWSCQTYTSRMVSTDMAGRLDVGTVLSLPGVFGREVPGWKPVQHVALSDALGGGSDLGRSDGSVLGRHAA